MIYSVDFSRHDGSFCDEKKIFFKFSSIFEKFGKFCFIFVNPVIEIKKRTNTNDSNFSFFILILFIGFCY